MKGRRFCCGSGVYTAEVGETLMFPQPIFPSHRLAGSSLQRRASDKSYLWPRELPVRSQAKALSPWLSLSFTRNPLCLGWVGP